MQTKQELADYVPYGEQWEKEMSKFPKIELIKMLGKQFQKAAAATPDVTVDAILNNHVKDIYLFTNGTLEKREQFRVAVHAAMQEYASQFQSKDVEAKELEADMYDEAVFDVLAEVRRAKTIFKETFHNQHEGYAVILEELDELWQEVKKNQKVYDIPAQRKEAIQCGAMCIRFIAELTSKLSDNDKQNKS